MNQEVWRWGGTVAGSGLTGPACAGRRGLPRSEWVQKAGKFGLTGSYPRRAWEEAREFKFTQLRSRLLWCELHIPIWTVLQLVYPSERAVRSFSVCARARPITNLIPDPDRIVRELSYKSRPRRSRGASKSNKTLTLLLASVIIYRVYPYISRTKKKRVHLITTLIGS